MFYKKDDELSKQIIEMQKRKEEFKIEKLLEDKLKQDPENIDALFRLAMLNMWVPFVDYSTSCVYLERVVSVSRKYRTIAELLISTKNRGLGFILKNIIYWFYAGKEQEVINELVKPLIKQVSEHGVLVDIQESTKSFFENELKQNPNDIEAILILMVMEVSKIREVGDKAAGLLEKIIEISKEMEAIALILYTYLMDFSYIDEDLLNRLKNVDTKNPEINSMVKYAISWFYRQNGDLALKEKYVKESVELYQGHVNNYVSLANIYYYQGRKAEAEQLIQKARSNIKKVYQKQSDFENYDSTSIEEQLNSLVKGIYITSMDMVKIW